MILGHCIDHPKKVLSKETTHTDVWPLGKYRIIQAHLISKDVILVACNNNNAQADQRVPAATNVTYHYFWQGQILPLLFLALVVDLLHQDSGQDVV